MRLPRPERRRHSIVLTSLVDVMFVLLFFFMLAASAVERRAVSVGLPTVSRGAGADRELRLDLASEDGWMLDGEGVAPADLSARLRDTAQKRVLIQVAPGLRVQTLTDAITQVRDSGKDLRLARMGAASS